MRCPSSFSDRGTVTAEFAIGIPTVLGVVGLLLMSLRWGMDGAAATMVAAETSLAIVRGDHMDTAVERARHAIPRATWQVERSTSGVCTTATIVAPVPFVPAQQVEQCAGL